MHRPVWSQLKELFKTAIDQNISKIYHESNTSVPNLTILSIERNVAFDVAIDDVINDFAAKITQNKSLSALAEGEDYIILYVILHK